jgi:hypothetical protein
MHPLAVLKYCREVLTERQRRDQWDGWFWSLRCKVIDFWISRMEREAVAAMTSESTVAGLAATERTDSWQADVEPTATAVEFPELAVPPLTTEEQAAVRRSHPLLTSRVQITRSLLEIDQAWQAELRARVERYLVAAKAHR